MEFFHVQICYMSDFSVWFLRYPYWPRPFQIIVKRHADGLFFGATWNFQTAKYFSDIWAVREQIRQQNCDFRLPNPVISWALCCDPLILGLRPKIEGFIHWHNIFDFLHRCKTSRGLETHWIRSMSRDAAPDFNPEVAVVSRWLSAWSVRRSCLILGITMQIEEKRVQCSSEL